MLGLPSDSSDSCRGLPAGRGFAAAGLRSLGELPGAPGEAAAPAPFESGAKLRGNRPQTALSGWLAFETF